MSEGGPVGEVPCVTDVVDAHPDAEQGVGGCPGGVGGRGDHVAGEFGGLVDEGEDARGVGCYEGGVGGGAAVGEVVGEDEGGIEGCDEEVNPL